MKKFYFFPEVLKKCFYFWFTRPMFWIKLLKLMIILFNWILPLFLCFRGILVFVSSRKHLLSTLLSLEFIVLGLFLFLFIYLNIFNYERFFRIIFLTFRVCEGALGLGILVSIIRTHGNDYFNSFRILQC